MKKLLAVLLLSVMFLSLIACSDATTQTDAEGVSVAETTKKQNKPKEETEETTVTEKHEEVVEDTTPILTEGESASTEKCEFTVDYIYMTKDFITPQPGSWYSHYEAEHGKLYIDLCIAFKNTDTSAVNADDVMSGKLIYGEKYEYTGFSIIEEDSRSDFTYSNITSISPLCTEYVHYLFEVPEEIDSTDARIVLQMTICEEEFLIAVRSGSTITTENTAQSDYNTSGKVAVGEVVVTANSEFYVDYSAITKDVIPPQPGDWYSHYEADEGKTYVDICFAYKNTANTKVGADDIISAKLKYAETYEYTGFSMIEEDSRSDFTYSNITSISPLCTEYVHYLFEVPEEVETSTESVEISFTTDGNTYTYKVR